MKKMRKVRHALFMSVISMMLCCAMLVGTTFAWFTDEVVSTGNIIKSGTLDVEMYWADELLDSSSSEWKNASEGAIFDYQYWEPGYTEVKYVKIANEGNLAFRYKLNVIPSILPAVGEVNLADVIDVYMKVMPANAAPVVRADVNAAVAAGQVATLSSLLYGQDPDGAAYGILLPTDGASNVTLAAEDQDIAVKGEVIVAIALKMQESAGNEYQNLTVGDGFKVQLLATQYTWENDSFDNQYDTESDYLAAPVAKVTRLAEDMLNISATAGIGGAASGIKLDAGFQFEPTESATAVLESPYRWWHADFVVYADKDVPADSVALAGYYDAWCQYNNDNWVALANTGMDISAGEEIRLVEGMGGGAITVNYKEICEYGNDGIGFRCGLAALDPSLEGTTVTVELRLYEVENDDSDTGSHNEETGKYITLSTYSYTFGDFVSVWDGTSSDVPVEDTATSTYTINNAAQLKGFADAVAAGNNFSGKTVVLNADIDLADKAWTPIGQTGATQFMGTFDGQGHTISNLNIDFVVNPSNHYSSGLFGWLNAATVKNLNIDSATVKGNHNVGVIAGYLETSGCNVTNCHVSNATITVSHLNDEQCGDKVGAIVGHAGNSGVSVSDCSATNCTVVAGRDAGQIVGAALTANIVNCEADNVVVSADGSCTGANVRNELIGRVLG